MKKPSELNTEQTLKALECCGNKGRADCKNCPMEEKRGCAIELYSKAKNCIFNLINIIKNNGLKYD